MSQADESYFMACWRENIEFREEVVALFEKARLQLKADFERNQKSRKSNQHYGNLEITTVKDFDNIWTPAQSKYEKSLKRASGSFSETSFKTFMRPADSGSLGLDTIRNIISRFDPILKFEEIVAPVLNKHTFSLHEDIVAAHIDPAVEMILTADPDDRLVAVAGAAIEFRSLGGELKFGCDLRSAGIGTSDLHFSKIGGMFSKIDNQFVDHEHQKYLEQSGKENGRKLALVDLKPKYNLSDGGAQIELILQESNYFDIMATLKTICNEEAVLGTILNDRSNLRRVAGSMHPERNRVPNSLCLHYIVRFSDRHYLSIHRHDRVAYDPLRVSVSGEEQLKIEDLSKRGGVSPARHWVYRSLLEEVFPRKDVSIDSVRGTEVISMVDQIRFLSIIFEERFCNFALVCLVQMKKELNEYIDFYRMAKDPNIDFEGNRYYFAEDEIASFFRSGELILTPFKKSLGKIYAQAQARVSQCNQKNYALHSSSLFRLWKIAETFDLVGGNDMLSCTLNARR